MAAHADPRTCYQEYSAQEVVGILGRGARDLGERARSELHGLFHAIAACNNRFHKPYRRARLWVPSNVQLALSLASSQRVVENVYVQTFSGRGERLGQRRWRLDVVVLRKNADALRARARILHALYVCVRCLRVCLGVRLCVGVFACT